MKYIEVFKILNHRLGSPAIMITTLLFMAISSEAFADSNFFVAAKGSSHSDSSPHTSDLASNLAADLTSNLKENFIGSVGHTYSYSSSAIIETEFFCGEIVADLKRRLIDSSLFEKHFAYDYVFLCIRSGENSFVTLDLNVEPLENEFLPQLIQYLASRQGKIIHQQTIHFVKLQKIEIEKTFTAEFQENNETPSSPRFSVTSNQKIEFANIAQYKKHLQTEVDLFQWNPDSEKIQKYLAKYLEPSELTLFKKYGLSQSNRLRTNNARNITTIKGETIGGIYNDGALRNCQEFNENTCLEKN